MEGICVTILSYVKPRNLNSFFHILKDIIWGIGDLLIFVLPFSRHYFCKKHSSRFTYLFIISGIACMLLSIIYTVFLLEIERYKLLSVFLLFISSWYIECCIFPFLVKLTFLFRLFSLLAITTSANIVFFILGAVLFTFLE